MSAIVFVVTNAGRAALVNATNTGTAPVTIAACGITATAITPSATTTSLPGEIKRIATLSGSVVAADTIHLIVRDATADTYNVKSMALYLADGTLFASYGQTDVIIGKAPAALMLLAVDIKFVDVAATSLTFGDANFLNPPATTDAQGVVELATDAETVAATDAVRAVTPHGLGAKLANYPGKAETATISARWTYTLAPLVGSHEVWHYGNDGAGSGLDADVVRGLAPSSSALANTIAARDASGHLFGNYFNTQAPNSENPSPQQVIVTNGSDGYFRKISLSAFIGAGGFWTVNNDGAGSGLDADTLDGLNSTDFSRASDVGSSLTQDTGVAKYLRWKNFGSGHVIIDASNGTAPNGATIPNNGAQIPWSPTYPMLVGWNGANTYSVKVNLAALADQCATHTNGTGLWSVGNDGSGSGLDCDLIRGENPGYFMRSYIGQWIVSADAQNRFYFAANGSTYIGAPSNIIFRPGGSASDLATLNTAGQFVAVDFGSISDERLKTDIEELDGADCAAALDEIGAQRFTKDGRRQLGGMAQAFRKHFPEVVGEDEDGWLHVFYGAVTAPIIAALNHRGRQLTDALARIEALEAARP